MPARSSESFILQTYPFREADLIVSFFTRDQGKLRGVARRARRPKSNFGSALERLSHATVSYYQKENRRVYSDLGGLRMRTKCATVLFCLFVAITTGESQSYPDIWTKYNSDLKTSPSSSQTLFRIGELAYEQRNFQLAANSFRAALNGDLQPKWTEVWSHIYLGKIFDVTSQRDRAVSEYLLAEQTNDNTRGAMDEAATYLQIPFPRP